MLASAGYISTGFDAVTLAGTTPANVTFDTTAVTGIFNPSSGGATVQNLDPTLFGRALTTDGYWIYRGSDIRLYGVGTHTTGDYTVLAAGLKLSACQQINTTLHGTLLTAAPPTLTGITDALLFGTTVTAATPTFTGLAVDLQTPALGVSGWANGCYQTATANSYVYIHTLLAQ